jgi:hypothetical protein
LDLLQAKQKHGGGFDIPEARTNSQHLPLTILNAAGQTTTHTHNAAARAATNAKAKRRYSVA